MMLNPELIASLEPEPEHFCGRPLCADCKKKRRKAYLRKLYVRTHPKFVSKEVKALDALYRHKRTIEELQGILKTSRTAVRIYMTTLRKKGYVIKKVGSYYRLLN